MEQQQQQEAFQLQEQPLQAGQQPDDDRRSAEQQSQQSQQQQQHDDPRDASSIPVVLAVPSAVAASPSPSHSMNDSHSDSSNNNPAVRTHAQAQAQMPMFPPHSHSGLGGAAGLRAPSLLHLHSPSPSPAPPAPPGPPPALHPLRPNAQQVQSSAAATLSGTNSGLNSPLSPNSAAAGVQSMPLHRRVQLPGIPGRFLRGLLTALAGAAPGAQHLLIDVSWTPVGHQLDPRLLAEFMATTGALVGLSCDMLVCHAGTTSADLTHGPPVIQQHQQQEPPFQQHQQQHQQQQQQRPKLYTRNLGSAASFGQAQGVVLSSQGPLAHTSPELGPTSQFLRSHPPPPGSQPTTLQHHAHLQQQQLQQQQSSSYALDIMSPASSGGGDGSGNEQFEDNFQGAAGAGQAQQQQLQGAPLRRQSSLESYTSAQSLSLAGAAARGIADGNRSSSPLNMQQQQVQRHSSAYGVDEQGWGAGLSGSLADSQLSGGGGGASSASFPLASAAASPTSMAVGGGGASSSSSYARGPIFSNIFLAHHLHNAPSDVQDVLLQALRIKQISVDGLPVNLPAIHLCVATHSSSVLGSSSPGIAPRLLDEFVLDIQADANFFASISSFLCAPPLPPPTLQALVPLPWAAVRQLVNADESSRGIFLSDKMGQYARDIAIALRQHGRVALGPSPQAMAALIHAAKCHAFFGGATFVRPVDIDSVAEAALCHRLLLRGGGGGGVSNAAAAMGGFGFGGGFGSSGLGGGGGASGLVVAAGGTGPSATAAQSRVLINHLINKVMLPPK